MKRIVQTLLFLSIGIAVIGGLTLTNSVNAMSDAASKLSYSVTDFELHKVDLDNNAFEIKLNANFDNPTITPIPLSNLLVRLNIKDQNGNWRELTRSIPTGNFTIASGPTKQLLKFRAPIAKEYFTLIPDLLKGNSRKIMVEVFPQIAGRNLEPVQLTEDFTLENSLTTFLTDKLGLGYTGNGHKNVIRTDKYDRFFPLETLDNTSIKISSGSHYGTLDEMKRIVNEYLSDTTAIGVELKRHDIPSTIKAVFDFTNDHIQYKLDKPGREELRRPARTWADRYTGVDCDCYSIFMSSILTNLKVPHSFRMTSYEANKAFSHVYVVAKHAGREYILDPVKGEWNVEHGPITKKYDKRVFI